MRCSVLLSSFALSPSLPRFSLKRRREILTYNGVLQAKVVLRGVWASGFSLFTLMREATCRLDSSLEAGSGECWNAMSRCGGKEEYSLLEERIYQNTWHHKSEILIFTAMKTTVEKFLLVVKTNTDFPVRIRTNVYLGSFCVVVGGNNSTVLSLHCKR